MRVKMSLSEWEYLLFVNETSLESSEFHATNPFANNTEELHTLSAQAEIAPLDMIADLFLDDVMSDNVSNIEQIRKLRIQAKRIPQRCPLIAPNLLMRLP